MQYTMRLDNGAEYGPAELETICGWARDKRVPKSALLVPANGGTVRSVLSVPELAAIIDPKAPPTTPGATPYAGQDSSTSAVIPYRNGCALVAYYLAVFSLLPLIGIVTGAVAFVLGILGLRAKKRRPAVHGTVHAWIGIIGGGGLALAQSAVVALYIGMILSSF